MMEYAKCVAVVPAAIRADLYLAPKAAEALPLAAPKMATPRRSSRSRAVVVGLQIGVEGVDLVMVIQNEEGMKHLLADKFQLGADASAAAGPVGTMSADTDWKMNEEILTYSRAKGVFAGLR